MIVHHWTSHIHLAIQVQLQHEPLLLLYFIEICKQKLVSSFLVIEAGLVCFFWIISWIALFFDIVGSILLGSRVALLAASNTSIYHRILKKTKIIKKE